MARTRSEKRLLHGVLKEESVMTWICNVCGYEVESDEKPTEPCPVCGADAKAFEEK
jgi:rubrerythrin